MNGYSNMEMLNTDMTNLTVKGLLKLVRDTTSGGSTVCSSSTDFVVRHVIQPAVEASVHSYLSSCSADGETLISDTWSLCGRDNSFNCDSIFNYTSKCMTLRQDCMDRSIPKDTTPKPKDEAEGFSMAGLMEDPAGIALLVGLVLLGVLIGIVSTIAVCLIWPKLHVWANAKLRSEKVNKSRVYRGESVTSGSYYTDIDEKQRQLGIHALHMTSSGESNSSVSILSRPHPSRFSDPAYAETAWVDHRDATYSHSQHPGYQPEPEPDYYDKIGRDSERKQSHKYAQIHTSSPKDTPDDYHSYFVLEKK